VREGGQSHRTTARVVFIPQTKIQHRRTPSHRARPEKGGAWLSRAPKSRKLPGAWGPHAEHRQLTRLVLAAAGAEDDTEHGWGGVCHAEVDEEV